MTVDLSGSLKPCGQSHRHHVTVHLHILHPDNKKEYTNLTVSTTSFSKLPSFPADNDLQGSDGSGSLGGPDVRRRIPIKLISKQPLRSKPQPRIQRPVNRPSKSEAGDDGRQSAVHHASERCVFNYLLSLSALLVEHLLHI